MFDQAFSKISSLAGPKLPARHQTLNHFLKLSISLPFDRHAMIAAAEENQEILAHCLSLVQAQGDAITSWHEHLSDQSLRDIALTLGNQSLRDHSNELHPVWQRPRLAQLLVSELALNMELEALEVHRLELLASLLDVGHRLLSAKSVAQIPRDRLVQAELDQFVESGDAAGAKWLTARGFSSADSDVLRYQYESIDQLFDAGDDIVLVALAGRIADAILSDFELADQYFQVIEARFGIDPTVLPSLFEQAFVHLRTQNDRMLSNSDFELILAEANLAQLFMTCSTQASVLELASTCFGVHALALGICNENELRLTYAGEQFRMPVSTGSSVLTRAFQSQTVFSAEENALVAILDRQLVSRMAANVLWIVPMGDTGIIVCGASHRKNTSSEYLIEAFRQACVSLVQKDQHSQTQMIELAEVQSRVRELTHEVNNPLAIVQNYLKTLSLRLGTDSTAQTDIKTIADEMLRIGGIIQKYAQIGAEPTSEVKSVLVNTILTDMTQIVQGSNNQVKVVLALDESLPRVQLPVDEFKQVLLNLMKNALEAMAGRDQSELAITTRGQVNLGGAHYIEVLIEDNGPGIPASIYQGLFSVDNSNKGGEHLGIGLSVANRLMTEMAGIISCRTSDSGTQFQLLIPTHVKQ